MEEIVLDVISLTEPIAEDNPAGVNIREDEKLRIQYYAIKDLRHKARTVERNAVQFYEMQETVKEWGLIYQQCVEIIKIHSKDLEVLAWLVEASLRLNGFAGLTHAFECVLELVSKYWDMLYPQEEDIEEKLAPIAGLNGLDADGTLIVPITMTLLTKNAKENYAFWQYKQALEISKITDQKKLERKLGEGVATLEEIIATMHATPPEFYHMLTHDLESCIAVYKKLTALFDQKFGQHSPPSSRILAALESCSELLGYLLQGTDKKNQTEVLDNTFVQLAHFSDSHRCKSPKSREEVLQIILQAADYFTVNEPQSIIPTVLQRAVRWAKMPLIELLQEIITDSGTIEHLANTTGIQIESKT